MMNIPFNFPISGVYALVLGTMQDGGLPHAGCECAACTAAWHDPARVRYAAALAVVDTRQTPSAVHLIDATPDIKWQLHLLAPVLGPHPQRPQRLRQPTAVWLTHAHMGHIAGLPQLSKEAMFVQQLPVYALTTLLDLIRDTRLWRPLVDELDLRPLAAGHAVSIGADTRITAVKVPHRDEWGIGTVAYLIRGPQRTLLYLPDIDRWEQWPQAEETLRTADIALVDASFYSADELNGRPPVAHPLVTDTIARWSHLPTEIVLTHFNHTNPLLDAHSSAADAVARSGMHLARTGQVWSL